MTEQYYLSEGGPMEGSGMFDGGNGFSYSPFFADADFTELAGIWEWHGCTWHRDKHDEAVRNGVFEPDFEYLDIPGTVTVGTWTFSNTEDLAHLTISPSILCRQCGFHGFLTEGEWRSV